MRALPSNSRHRFSHSSFSLRQRPTLEIPNDDNPLSKVGEKEWYDLEDGGGKGMKEGGEKKGTADERVSIHAEILKNRSVQALPSWSLFRIHVYKRVLYGSEQENHVSSMLRLKNVNSRSEM